jgi:hypothetical protein
MKKLLLGLAAAISTAGAAAGAQAAPMLVAGVDHPGDAVLEKSQYIYGGHDYCWYDGGWRGPGWYWCGYAGRHGWGWGGPAGWRGWYYGPRYWRGGAWVGPHGYRHREWGGWRGGRDWHGGRDWRGDHDGRGDHHWR